MSTIDEWRNQIHQGDARETLAEMPADSVDCVMTSPPYFGLRDYGDDGQIGIESSLDEYIVNLVSVFDELHRVLKPTGSFWLNLGDSYAGSWGNHGTRNGEQREVTTEKVDRSSQWEGYADGRPATSTVNLPNKCKMMVPHRVAMALVDSEWILRNDVVWKKPNPMPHSVKDRLNTTFEYVFHFVQQGDYHYDLDAIREPHTSDPSRKTFSYGDRTKYDEGDASRTTRGLHSESAGEVAFHDGGKNPGDVFEVTTKPYPDAHFAVYPKELCEKPIKATCPEDGVVLDPFAGAGTTCLAARELGRRFIGIDLNPEYVAMAQARVGVDVDQPELLDGDHTPLTAFADGGGDDA